MELFLTLASSVMVFALLLWAALVLAKKSTGGFWALFATWAVPTGVLTAATTSANGWEALGYFLVLLLWFAPAGAGLLIGGLVGWARRPAQAAL